MKKQILLLILITLFLTGCNGNAEPKSDENINNIQQVDEVKSEEFIPTEVEINNLEEIDIYQRLISNEDSKAADCDVIKDNNLKQNCTAEVIKKQALKESNPELCKQIEDIMLQKLCADQISETTLLPNN